MKVIVPSKGELIEYDWYKVHEKLGVYPNQVIDYKGLRGDTSDNIPGIRGIGEKTAQKLLAEYRTMDNIFEHCEEIQGKALKQKICEGKEIGRLSQERATIIRDVDIDFDFDGTHITLPEISKVTEFLKKMQFYNFLRNIDNILSSFDKEKKGQPKELKPLKIEQNDSTDYKYGTFEKTFKNHCTRHLRFYCGCAYCCYCRKRRFSFKNCAGSY